MVRAENCVKRAMNEAYNSKAPHSSSASLNSQCATLVATSVGLRQLQAELPHDVQQNKNIVLQQQRHMVQCE